MATTAKQRYDAEMKKIQESRAQSTKASEAEFNQMVNEMDDELEEGEMHLVEEQRKETFDKCMGAIKESSVKTVTMTRQEHDAIKASNEAKDSLLKLSRKQRDELSESQRQKIEQIAKSDVTDPVVLHLLKKREELSERYRAMNLRSKEIQIKMLEEITKTSNIIIELKGAMKEVDRDLLKQLGGG